MFSGKAHAKDHPMKAYDIEMLTRSTDPARNHGWCFGLPPGISPQQWPLDPANGHSLMHGFTLLLPEDYRVHGPEIVALSFFATPPDHNDGRPATLLAVSKSLPTPELPSTPPPHPPSPPSPTPPPPPPST